MKLLDPHTRRVEAVIDRFEQAWAEGRRPEISRFLSGIMDQRDELLAELSLVDAAWRREKEKFVHVEYYLDRYPQLRNHHRFCTDFERDLGEHESSVRLEHSLHEIPIPLRSLPQLGRFEGLEQVATGGFGTVYRARDPALNRVVAIKIPRSGNLATALDRKRFAREAQHVGQLKHAGIVEVHEVGEAEGVVFLVSEFIAGTTLADAIESQEFPPVAAVEIVLQVAEALEHAHQHGVVHRDVKPSNIMLEPVVAYAGEKCRDKKSDARKASLPYRVRVTDFGLARQMDTKASVTTDGQLVGTVAYMSPEQASGNAADADARSDVFSAGVIFYELLAGSRPFTGIQAAVLERIQHGQPQPLQQVAPSVHRDLETICLKCLQKQPAKRYASAAALAADLRSWQRREAISARRPNWAEKLGMAVRRRPALWAAIFVAVGLLLVTLTGLHMHNSRLQREVVRADVNAAQAQWQLYVSNMNLASTAWNQGLVGRVRELLEPFREPETAKDLRGWEWHYLWAQSHSEAQVVQAHAEPIIAAAFSKNGKLWASATQLGELKLWEASSGVLRETLLDGGPAIQALTFAQQGGQLVSGDENGNIRIWDTNDGSLHNELEGHHGAVLSLVSDASGELLASSGIDGEVKVWQAATKELIWSFRAYSQTPIQVGFDALDTQTLLVLTADGILRKWQRGKDRELFTIQSEGAGYSNFAVSPQGDRVAVAGTNGQLVLIDAESGEEIRHWSTHPAELCSLAFSSDSTLLIGGARNATVQVWNVEAGYLSQTALGHTNQVAAVSLTPEADYLMSAGYDGALRSWRRKPNPEQSTKKRSSRTLCLRANALQNAFTAISQAGQFLNYELDDPKSLRSNHFHGGEVIRAADYSPRCQLMASGDDFGNVLFWDTKNGEQLVRLPTERTPISALRLNDQGNHLITGSEDGSVTLWDIAKRKALCHYRTANRAKISSLDLAADGSQIAAVSVNGSLNVWDALSGEQTISVLAHRGVCNEVAFSETGRILATAGSDRLIVLWDARTGRPLFELAGHESPIRCVTFAHHDQRVVTGDDAGSIRFWDVSMGQLLANIEHSGKRWSKLAFSSNQTLLAATDAGSVHCFHASDSKEFEELTKQIDFPQEDGAWKLNQDSWNIVRWPGASKKSYERAWRLAQKANRLLPDEPWLELTLGVACYRTGRLNQANNLLLKAQEGLPEHPFSVAFETMTAHKLGRAELVATGLEELRRAALHPSWRIDPNFVSQYREVIALILGDGILPSAPWKVQCYEWRFANENNSPHNFLEITHRTPDAHFESDRLVFDWGREGPAPGVSDRFFATVSVSSFDLEAGDYELQVVSKNGVRVYRDDRLLVDNWNPEESKIGIHSFRSIGGTSVFRVEHYKSDGPAYLDLRVFPLGQLTHAIDLDH